MPWDRNVMCKRPDKKEWTMTFEERLDELITFYTRIGKRDEDYLQDADIRHFHKWRMKSEWLLCQYLGEHHPFTIAFQSYVTEPSYSCVRAGRGILEALDEEFRKGNVSVVEESSLASDE
jgi:hypothetical protein